MCILILQIRVLMLSQKSNYKVFNILGEEILNGQGLSIDISYMRPVFILLKL